ncbi:MAG: O-antigen ligase family protein [Thermodesulfobacteriota bacterium]|nr:O-antigen ligase family protein [Thermodesulfobacteriota bacterium]
MEKAAFIIFLVVLILSPLLFGAVHTYAYTIMSLGVLIGALLLIRSYIRKDLKSGLFQFHVPATSLNFLFLIFLGFLFFQITPLPDVVVELLSPEARIVGEKSLPATGMSFRDGREDGWFALSPYIYPVRMSVIRWTVYGMFFFGLIRLLNSRKRIELTIFLILITGCFEALYGLIQTYSGSEYIWWYKKETHIGDVTGTYINRNHFAGLMEMCLFLAVSYSAGLTGKKRKVRTERKSSLRVRISRILSGEQRFNKRILILFSGVVIGIGLIFSASRGGMIGAAGGMLCMGLLFVFRKGHRRKAFIILIVFLAISISAIRIGVEYPAGRFKYFYDSMRVRGRYAQKTLDMFGDYRAAGIGVGNFKYAYPKYQAPEDKNVFIRHAHNDWAQFLAEAGILGLFLLLTGISYYIYQTLKLRKRRKDPFAVYLGSAPLAAMTALGIHSYSDFNLHYPANFLMLTAITAIGYSVLHLERHHRQEKSLLRYHVIPLRFKGVIFLALLLGLIGWSGLRTMEHFIAEAYCNSVPNNTLNRDRNPRLEDIQKSIEWDSRNAAYRYKLAGELVRIRNQEFGIRNSGEKKKRQIKIIEALETAVRLNPFNARYHMRLGWEYMYLWRLSDEKRKWLTAADISIDRAAYFAGEKYPLVHMSLGNYWIIRSKTIRPASLEWETAWSKASWHYNKAQRVDPRKRLPEKIKKFVWEYYPDKVFIRRALDGAGQFLPEELP